MRELAFKGGPADGLTAKVDGRDLISVIRVAVLVSKGFRAVAAPDDPAETVTEEIAVPRAVVLTASIDRADLAAAYERWVDYFRWPSLDDDEPVEYRAERPPTFAGGFSASG
jgi:hypothetical protein